MKFHILNISVTEKLQKHMFQTPLVIIQRIKSRSLNTLMKISNYNANIFMHINEPQQYLHVQNVGHKINIVTQQIIHNASKVS